MNKPFDISNILIIIIIILAFGIFCAVLTYFVNDFLPELKYLNIEIRRSVGHEKRYYKRKRRRLWLSLLPFVKY